MARKNRHTSGSKPTIGRRAPHHQPLHDRHRTDRARRQTKKSYDDILARQQAYEDRFVRQPQQLGQSSSVGCVFAKSCNLSEGVINHGSPAGFVPVEKLTDYGKILPAGWPRKGCGGKHPTQKNQWQRVTCCTGNASSGRGWCCWYWDGCCWRRHSDGWYCSWSLGRNGCIAVAVELGRQRPVHRRTAQIAQGRPYTGSTACRATS